MIKNIFVVLLLVAQVLSQCVPCTDSQCEVGVCKTFGSLNEGNSQQLCIDEQTQECVCDKHSCEGGIVAPTPVCARSETTSATFEFSSECDLACYQTSFPEDVLTTFNCEIACENPVCNNNCQEYVVVDGCPTCECKEEPPVCEQPACNIQCEEYVLVNGCPTCECKPQEPACDPNFTCELDCVYATNADGCDICKCKEEQPQCDEPMCEMECPNGFKEKDGCPICECNPQEPGCDPNFTCELDCVYATNADGCDICKCKEEQPQCDEPMCDMECPNGFKERDGCPICECDVCPELDCAAVHNNGNVCDKHFVNEDGCETCECFEGCDPNFECELDCILATDNNDCSVCKCESNVNEDVVKEDEDSNDDEAGAQILVASVIALFY